MNRFYPLFILLSCLFLMQCDTKEKKSSLPKVHHTKHKKIIDAKLMMTFAAIADEMNEHEHDEKNTIEGYLKRKDLETKGQWEMVWVARNYENSISAFIAKLKEDNSKYVIAFSGTDLYNIFEDSKILELKDVEPLFETMPDEKVSKGSKKLYEILFKLRYQKKTIFEVIDHARKENPDANFYFCGHSLGSTLAVYYSYFVKLRCIKNHMKIKMHLWAFANPSFYNREFVNQFLKTNFDKHFYSIKNDQVHMNYFWNMENLYKIPYPMSDKLKEKIKKFGEDFAKKLPTEEDKYVSFPSIKIENKIPVHERIQEKKLKTKIDFIKWEVFNHNRNHYLYSLGGKCVPKDYNAPEGNYCHVK
ncbi:lipase family protein [Aureivirga sp. CE67]|uniref:lipase family protein n=1 Tax=Aureivirga sp. CE67 TaxID=1788983 RepID=UPI0018CB820A|nr:hypothetical protein [Aureivirga sp. CE67]